MARILQESLGPGRARACRQYPARSPSPTGGQRGKPGPLFPGEPETLPASRPLLIQNLKSNRLRNRATPSV